MLGLRGRPAARATSSTTCGGRARHAACRRCSSQAMPATRTVPRPAGHERVDGRRLEPRVEAGAVLEGRGPAGAATHLLRGASGGRQGADRLRPRVLQAVSRRQDGAPATRVDPTSSRSSSSHRAASPPASRPASPPSMITAGARTSTWPRASRSGCAFTRPRSSGWPTPSRCISATSPGADGRWRIYIFADGDDPTGPDPAPAAVRVPGVSAVADEALHADRRRTRLRDQRARRIPAGTATWPSTRCPTVLLPRKGSTA